MGDGWPGMEFLWDVDCYKQAERAVGGDGRQKEKSCGRGDYDDIDDLINYNGPTSELSREEDEGTYYASYDEYPKGP